MIRQAHTQIISLAMYKQTKLVSDLRGRKFERSVMKFLQMEFGNRLCTVHSVPAPASRQAAR